jgi:hypothetical protein
LSDASSEGIINQMMSDQREEKRKTEEKEREKRKCCLFDVRKKKMFRISKTLEHIQRMNCVLRICFVVLLSLPLLIVYAQNLNFTVCPLGNEPGPVINASRNIKCKQYDEYSCCTMPIYYERKCYLRDGCGEWFVDSIFSKMTKKYSNGISNIKFKK